MILNLLATIGIFSVSVFFGWFVWKNTSSQPTVLAKVLRVAASFFSMMGLVVLLTGMYAALNRNFRGKLEAYTITHLQDIGDATTDDPVLKGSRVLANLELATKNNQRVLLPPGTAEKYLIVYSKGYFQSAILRGETLDIQRPVTRTSLWWLYTSEPYTIEL